MKFNYSYRAFIITCLLVGNLILILISVKLGSKQPQEEEVMAVEYTELLPEPSLEPAVSEKMEVETNTAYNEAEEFIKELENSRNNTATSSQSEEDPTARAATTYNDLAVGDAKQQLDAVKDKLSKKSKLPEHSNSDGSNHKTTISYRLKNRKSINLPNPVYTCDRGGKVVITVEVNTLGKVVKTTYNKLASTTSNGCLIDSAIAYAQRATFTTKAGKNKQIGTITYNFPGQY